MYRSSSSSSSTVDHKPTNNNAALHICHPCGFMLEQEGKSSEMVIAKLVCSLSACRDEKPTLLAFRLWADDATLYRG